MSQRKIAGWRLWGCSLLLGLSSVLAYATPNKVALLVGVGHYPKPEHRLEGPAHDVQALRQVLVQRWGYAPDRVQTLVDQAATRQAILQALGGLMQRTQPGDEVLVYFSGHGTSGLDPMLGLPVPDGSGAFIPVDANLTSKDMLGQLIVGRSNLRPVFEQLDRGGRKVWFISDSCFSGQQVRALRTRRPLPARLIPLRQFDEQALAAGARERFQQQLGQQPDWPYRQVVFLAASAEGETARDIPSDSLLQMPTIDGKPHGAMTDALLRALHGELALDANGDGQASLHEVHQAIGQFMASRAYGHTPQRLPTVLDDTKAVGQRILLKGGLVANKPQLIMVLRVAVADGLAEEWHQRLRAVSGLELVASTAAARVRLTLENDGSVLLSTEGDDVITRSARSDPGTVVGTLLQLAWSNRLDALAIAGRRAVLPAEIAPAALGGNFRVGDKLHFVVRPDRHAQLLLLNVDSQGKLSVLYPYQEHEMPVIQAEEARAIPGDQPQDRIQVQEPLGMDIQMVFAFDAGSVDLKPWLGQLDIPPGDQRLAALERLVQSAQGRYSYARTVLRVEPGGR